MGQRNTSSSGDDCFPKEKNRFFCKSGTTVYNEIMLRIDNLESEKELSLELNATLQNVKVLLGFIAEELEKHDCPPKADMQIELSAEELLVNIANYAYTSGVGKVKVTMHHLNDPTGVEIILEDQGIPYNPLEKPDPDVTLSAEERKIGGLGIYLAKKNMDEIIYEHQRGSNILTMRKFW